MQQWGGNSSRTESQGKKNRVQSHWGADCVTLLCVQVIWLWCVFGSTSNKLRSQPALWSDELPARTPVSLLFGCVTFVYVFTFPGRERHLCIFREVLWKTHIFLWKIMIGQHLQVLSYIFDSYRDHSDIGTFYIQVCHNYNPAKFDLPSLILKTHLIISPSSLHRHTMDYSEDKVSCCVSYL